jgi:hypothetical protein
VKISDLKIAVARKKLLNVAETSAIKTNAFKMGILLEVGDDKALHSFLQLRQELNLQDEDFKIVICREKDVKNAIFEYPFISIKDFSWNGSLKEESAAFLDAAYDVLISFTASENKMADLLVSVTRARLKVGRKKEDEMGIFDLNISSDLSAPDVFTAELKKYLKILKKTA